MKSMMRTGLLLAAATAGASACTGILGGFDYNGPPGTGGTSSTSSSGTGGATSSTSTTGTGGTGGMACTETCQIAATCAGQGNPCTTVTCDDGCCVVKPEPDGKSAGPAMQTDSDCKQVVCDGQGGTKTVNDANDPKDDHNPCTLDGCKNGSPDYTPTTGTCNDDGGTVCGAPNGTLAGKCVACNAATDCPPTGTACITVTCQSGQCLTANASMGATCSDNGGKVCNAAGMCLGCNSTNDCTSPQVCIGQKCQAPTCNDSLKDGDESDTDCGGSCTPCTAGLKCTKNSDCESVICAAGFTCTTPSCTDNVQNQSESDVDCGGPNCGKCDAGQKCNVNADCVGNKCTGGICTATCTDGVRNQDETDVDCGGVCNKCAFGGQCAVDKDCLSGFCDLNIGRCGAQVLASNQQAPQTVAVDGNNVYWATYGDGTTNGSVMKLQTNPTLGTTPVPLVNTEPGANGIAIDGAWPFAANFVYWSSNTSIRRKRADNTGAVETIATAQQAGIGIALNPAYSTLFWANSDGSIKKASTSMPFNVLPVGSLTSGFDQHIAADGTFVYWTQPNLGAIYKNNGGGNVMVVTGQNPWGIAVDAGSLYWSDKGSGKVQRMPVAGGSVIDLAFNLNQPTEIAIDASYVYAVENVNNNARVLQIPIGAGTMKVLASGMNRCRGVAVDDQWVYFTNGDNTIRRVHKQ